MLPLVEVKEGGDELVLNPKAIEIIQQVKGNVAVVAAVGAYRSGKSFLLNQLGRLHRGDESMSSDFAVGHTTKACTKGLWISETPAKFELSNGESCTLLFVDVEGFGATDKTQQYDSRLFVLATLLSSW
jgi:hypothetical protein